MDRGNWRATLHRVIQSWAGLKLLSMHARTPKSELVYKWPGPQTILLSLLFSPWGPTDPGTWLRDFLALGRWAGTSLYSDPVFPSAKCENSNVYFLGTAWRRARGL